METENNVFDTLGDDYDCIDDLWYSWLYARMHYFIADNISKYFSNLEKLNVLDVGCGTGFQSFLFHSLGCWVVGLDISESLLKLAKHKFWKRLHTHYSELFVPRFEFVRRYNRKIEGCLSIVDKSPVRHIPVFHFGSACNIPYSDAYFDVVNCCGSVLNFVDDYNIGLNEISRVLKPRGWFFIEIDVKYNLDLLWLLLSGSIRLSEFYNIINCYKHIRLEHWFHNGTTIKQPLRLFSKRKFLKDLKSRGLITLRTLSIHSITNLLPSCILCKPSPSKFVERLFNVLAKLEERFPHLPGNSLIMFGYKI